MNKKRILIIGFVVTLLIVIPITLFALTSNQKQNVTSKATPATTLSFSTLSQPVNVGQSFNLDIIMNPGSNQVSFVKLFINYDSSKITKGTQGIAPNATAFPTTLEGPVYNQCTGNNCTMSITLSVGADPTKVVTQTTTVATVNFQAVASTGTGTTQVTFGTQTQVLSIAASDQPSENVLSTTTPANITINDAGAGSGTPIPTGTGGTGTPTPTTGVTGGTNQSPVCSSLAVDMATGSAPLTSNFTATGNDPDGTVSKVTFNFGDGSVQDVTSGGGIGTNSINAQLSHIYQSSGSFTATAILTDNQGAISGASACTQVITVSAGTGTASATPTQTGTPTVTKSPTLPPTGPGIELIGFGIFGIVLSIVGGFLLFGL